MMKPHYMGTIPDFGSLAGAGAPGLGIDPRSAARPGVARARLATRRVRRPRFFGIPRAVSADLPQAALRRRGVDRPGQNDVVVRSQRGRPGTV